MRRMILELSPQLLAQMLKTGTGMVEVVDNPLPADARIVDARLSFGGINLQLVIESETFREVDPGSHLGYLPSPVFRQQPMTEDEKRIAQGWRKIQAASMNGVTYRWAPPKEECDAQADLYMEELRNISPEEYRKLRENSA